MVVIERKSCTGLSAPPSISSHPKIVFGRRLPVKNTFESQNITRSQFSKVKIFN